MRHRVVLEATVLGQTSLRGRKRGLDAGFSEMQVTGDGNGEARWVTGAGRCRDGSSGSFRASDVSPSREPRDIHIWLRQQRREM